MLISQSRMGFYWIFQLPTRERVSELFDFVVVCTSFSGTPFTPTLIPGIAQVQARILHSHDIRNEFRLNSKDSEAFHR